MNIAIVGAGIGGMAAAMAHQHQVSVEPPITVERTGCFHRSAEFVVGANQSKRGSGREQLCVRGGGEQLVGALRVEDLAGGKRRALRNPRIPP